VADFVLPKPSQAKPSLAPKAPKKKIEHVAAKWLTLFCPSQAKPSQGKPSLAPKAPQKKIEHVAAKAPCFFCPSQAKPSQAKPRANASQVWRRRRQRKKMNIWRRRRRTFLYQAKPSQSQAKRKNKLLFWRFASSYFLLKNGDFH
jgi:hypothetical protein